MNEKAASVREKAGDGSTDFIVEIRQSELKGLLDRLDNFTRQEWLLRNRAEVAERGHQACLAREREADRV